MKPLRVLARSLTLRLGLLYAASTVLIVVALSFYLVAVIEGHFLEEDMAEMRGKLELSSRLVERAHAEGGVDHIAHHLDEALVGHHHLALALLEDGVLSYQAGHQSLPAALFDSAQGTAGAAAPYTWTQQETVLRGIARRLRPLAEGPTYTIAVAVDTTHHREFIASFRVALGVVLVFSALLAIAFGWGAARLGLAPLRHTAALAREISAERLAARLPADSGPPELQELSVAFNGMLDRLHDSITRLSGFAADLAHEMRTPVSNLMMQTQVMLAQTRSSEEYRDVLASNLEEFERLARTIGDMLFLAKADNGLIVPCQESLDLAAEMADLAEFYGILAEEGGRRLDVAGEAVTRGDRLMLRRALSNLLSNALRHAPAGSDITVRLAKREDSVELAMENACAAPPDVPVERLFDRFTRGSPARREGGEGGEGAGLGLAITRSIVTAHGGRIHAALQGERIRFVIELPAA